jgi:hypothetical protein
MTAARESPSGALRNFEFGCAFDDSSLAAVDSSVIAPLCGRGTIVTGSRLAAESFQLARVRPRELEKRIANCPPDAHSHQASLKTIVDEFSERPAAVVSVFADSPRMDD